MCSKFRKNDISQLIHLIFSPGPEDVKRFERQILEDTSKGGVDWLRNCRKVHKSVQQNFVAAKDMHGTEVGRLMRDRELMTNVIYILVDDCLDPERDIRRRLVKSPVRMYQWGQATALTFNVDMADKDRQEFKRAELASLQKYLKKVPVHSLHIQHVPTDEFLQAADDVMSVTEQLWDLFEKDGVDIGSEAEKGTLVFIGPVNTDVVDHRACVHKCMEFFLEERLTPDKKVYCVFDIGPQFAMERAMDMISSLPEHVSVKLLTGLDPEQDQVTCMLLELEFVPGGAI